MRSIVTRWRPQAGERPPEPDRVAAVPVLRLTLELPLPVPLPLLACAGAGSSLRRVGRRPGAAADSRPGLSLRWADAGAVLPMPGPGGRKAQGAPVAAGFALAMRHGPFLFVPLGGRRALGREWRIHRLALRCRDLLAPPR